MLHTKFVVVPIDRAGSSVAFLHKSCHAQVLNNALGPNNVNNIT